MSLAINLYSVFFVYEDVLKFRENVLYHHIVIVILI